MNLFYSFSSLKALGRYPLIFACNIAGGELDGSFFVFLLSVFGMQRMHLEKHARMGIVGVNGRLADCCLSC